MRSPVGLEFSTCEPVGEFLEVVRGRGIPVRERNAYDLISTLRSGCAVPRSVECDERAAAIMLRERSAGIEHQTVRCPVCREVRGRRELRCAIADRFATVTTVLGRKHQLLLSVVEIE